MKNKRRLVFIGVVVLVIFVLLAVFVYFFLPEYIKFPSYTKTSLIPVHECEQYLDIEIDSESDRNLARMESELKLHHSNCTCYGEAIMETFSSQYSCRGIEVCEDINETMEDVCKDYEERIRRFSS